MSDVVAFTPPCPLHTPVLFLVYKRPDTTKQVFEAIRQAKPPRLYVAADGPKLDVPGEVEKVRQVREIVLNGVDWDCEVKTLFREENLGCKYGVSGGIDWFFENEEEGIILEDDTLPSQSFFWFCQELLERYRDDDRIGQISGFNPLMKYESFGESYLFSKFGPIWGWASWRRVWVYYDVEMTEWMEVKRRGYVNFFTDTKKEKRWREKIFDNIYNKKEVTWDYQWSFSKLNNSFLSIIPSRNLIINIGFGIDATHTQSQNNKKIVSFELNHLVHPVNILGNKKFNDHYLNSFVFGSFFLRIRKKLLQLMLTVS